MRQNPQPPTICTETPEAGDQLARQIRGAGWWQGSVVEALALRAVDLSLPEGPSHWVVASQTCNLYSSDFGRIAKVEFVGAALVPDGQGKAAMRGGRHPRQLEALATSKSGSAWILCDNQTRHWAPRSCLAELAPSMALCDLPDGGPADRHKDIFARWLARRPPCGMDLTVVVRSHNDVEPVRATMKKLFDEPTVPNPPSPKRTRIEAMKAEVSIELAHKVVVADQWTVPDIERAVRYNFPDHFSGSDEAAGD